MSRKRSDPELRAYRMTLIPSLASVLPATAVYVITLNNGVCMGIRDGQPVAWMFGGTAYLAAHVAYSLLIDRAQERDVERERIKAGKPEMRERMIVHVRDADGEVRSGLYPNEARVHFVGNDKLAEICAAIVRAGEYKLRVVESVSTRKVYHRLTDELIRCEYAKWNNPAHHQQGVEITDIGWGWIRRRAKSYSPIGLRKSCELSGLRLTTHAHAGNARLERVR